MSVRCLDCNAVTNDKLEPNPDQQPDPDITLQVTIPGMGTASLESVLWDDFLAREVLLVDCRFCDAGNASDGRPHLRLTTGVKSENPTSAAFELVVQTRRIVSHNLPKLFTKVEVPHGPFMLPQRGGRLAMVKSVLFHEGQSVHAGHYFASTRPMPGEGGNWERWVKCDDETRLANLTTSEVSVSFNSRLGSLALN